MNKYQRQEKSWLPEQYIKLDSFLGEGAPLLSPKQMLEANFTITFSSKDFEFEELEEIKQFAEFIKNQRK